MVGGTPTFLIVCIGQVDLHGDQVDLVMPQGFDQKVGIVGCGWVSCVHRSLHIFRLIVRLRLRSIRTFGSTDAGILIVSASGQVIDIKSDTLIH